MKKRSKKTKGRDLIAAAAATSATNALVERVNALIAPPAPPPAPPAPPPPSAWERYRALGGNPAAEALFALEHSVELAREHAARGQR